MKILLTGSTGFIGHHLREAWSGRGVSAPNRQELDLMDAQAVERYLRDGKFDAVVHAASVNDVRHPMDARRVLDGNLRMFCNLERCRGLYGKMIYFGSGAEYGMEHYIPHMRESYFGVHIPGDPYGFSKYVMSKWAEGNIYDLRLFGVFGEYEEWRRRFISNMLWQGLSGGIMRMNQNAAFDYIYIQDLIPVVEWFITHQPRHHHYNVCSGNSVELLELAEIIAAVIGGEIQVSHEGKKRPYTGDNSRLLEETGPLSLTPMPEAVRKMADYYQKNGFPDY